MFKVFDAHCDTADVLYDSGLSLKKNNFHIDRERMFRYDKYLQVYAAYIDKDGINCSPMNRCIALLEKIHKELDLNNIPVIKTGKS